MLVLDRDKPLRQVRPETLPKVFRLIEVPLKS